MVPVRHLAPFFSFSAHTLVSFMCAKQHCRPRSIPGQNSWYSSCSAAAIASCPSSDLFALLLMITPCASRFIVGFFLGAIPWYVGAFLLCCSRVDYREKPGYVACVAAVSKQLVSTYQIALVDKTHFRSCSTSTFFICAWLAVNCESIDIMNLKLMLLVILRQAPWRRIRKYLAVLWAC